MLRSLWSGVSGMQGHQIALDVESNNIANVNTYGFKYSRADFSTMISQVRRSATIPYGGYGGVNDFSIGLGTSIQTTTKVFSQGSLQNTDRKADLALVGDGMFVLSNNGGFTRVYSRDGAFGFDAEGNLVNTSGFIVQGWLRDLSKLDCSCGAGEINRVDSTGPLRSIQIDPRLTIPAKATNSISGNVNLTSGSKTENLTCPSSLDSTPFNNYQFGALDRIYDTNNRQLEYAQDMGVMFNGEGNAMKLQEGQGIWVSYQTAQSNRLELSERPIGTPNAGGGEDVTTTVEINGTTITWTNNAVISGSSHLLAAVTAINRFKDQTGVEALMRDGGIILQNLNNLDGDDSKKNIRVTLVPDNNGYYGIFGDVDNLDGQNDGTGISDGAGGWMTTQTVTTAFKYTYTTQPNADSASGNFRTTEDIRALMQQDANRVKIFGGDSTAYGAALQAGNIFMASTFSVSVKLTKNGTFEINNKQDGYAVNDANSPWGVGPAYDSLNIYVSAFNDMLTTTNVLFKQAMQGLNTGVLVEGGNVTTSGSFRLANYGQTVEVYDSLGNKHELQFEFVKISQNEWSFRVIAPEPAEFWGATAQRPNILEGGNITFGENGQVIGFNPNSFQFLPKTGAASPQEISIDFGISGTFTGFTSTAADSYANDFSGNGYASGVLKDYYFDATGTMIGNFSNGINLALAQVAVATFVNYEGLQEAGGNLYTLSPNSGDPTYGPAGSAGRADIQAMKLEMSNADLSRGLTNLIIVQRGFQASSKSVTTSDQILNTLINLKQ